MKNNKPSEEASRALRIIGGQWRSRKITFADNKAIRPTPDRVRETLFNWLKAYVPGSRCLELYAGSGILAMEALSRGAAHVTLLDHGPDIVSKIKQNLETLEADSSRYACICTNALAWLEQQSEQQHTAWDIIFLDPPFAPLESSELTLLLALIAEKQLLNPDGLVYIETAEPLEAQHLPVNWKIHRSKKAASVHYCLCHSPN